MTILKEKSEYADLIDHLLQQGFCLVGYGVFHGYHVVM